MLVPDGAVLEVLTPDGWSAMPDPDGDAVDPWLIETVQGLGLEGRGALLAARSLAEALELAQSQHVPRRLRWVTFGTPPRTVVQAWAFLDLAIRAEPEAEAAAARWEQRARAAGDDAGDASVWHREITRRTVRDQPAVVIHDLLTFQRAPAAPSLVQHRALVALFPPEQLVASLTVSTPHLGALPDIEATALTMAEGIRIEVSA